MKVKIGNKLYDSNKEPIMLILSDDDKKNIANMDQDKYRFCSYPKDDGYTKQEISDFMNVDDGK